MNLHAFFQEENPKVKLELFKNKSEEVYPLADIRIHRRKSAKTLSPLTNWRLSTLLLYISKLH